MASTEKRTVRLSTKWQVVSPKSIRRRRNREFASPHDRTDSGGRRRREASLFEPNMFGDDVCTLEYAGLRKTIEEMDASVLASRASPCSRIPDDVVVSRCWRRTIPTIGQSESAARAGNRFVNLIVILEAERVLREWRTWLRAGAVVGSFRAHRRVAQMMVQDAPALAKALAWAETTDLRPPVAPCASRRFARPSASFDARLAKGGEARGLDAGASP